MNMNYILIEMSMICGKIGLKLYYYGAITKQPVYKIIGQFLLFILHIIKNYIKKKEKLCQTLSY